MRRPNKDPARDVKLRAIRERARRLLDEMHMTSAERIDLDAIAKRVRAEVSIGELAGATARVIRIGDTARILVTNRLSDRAAVRFSIAHELAHLLLDHALAVDNGVIERLCNPLLADRRASEREASVCATELLMPEPMVRPLCEVSNVTLAPAHAIASTFATSLLASAMRFVEITDQRCAIVYSELGRVRWVKPSATFPAWIPNGRRLHPTSAAFEYSQRGWIDTQPHVLDASAWLPRSRIDDENAQIVEHSAVVPELGAVFSLIWLPDHEIAQVDLAA